MEKNIQVKSRRNLRIILSSLIVLLICLSLITTGTLALFSGHETVNNHLQAGSLNILLERVGLTQNRLDTTTGYMKEVTYSQADAYCNFSDPNNSDKNVFGISEYVAPTSRYEATMQITNSGTVAFGYWIGIDVTQNNDLAKQLKVKVSSAKEDLAQKYMVDDQGNAGVYVGDSSNFIHRLAINDEPDTFTVSIEFANDVQNTAFVNNDAEGQEVDFDLTVYAVQVVSES